MELGELCLCLSSNLLQPDLDESIALCHASLAVAGV